MKASRLLITLVGALPFALIASGCQTDLDIERYQYVCTSGEECSEGYRCAPLEGRDASICIPEDSEVGVADAANDADGGADADGGSDAGTDTDANTDTGTGDADVDTEPADRDGDGVTDGQDNCPDVFNPAQRMAEETGAPMACTDALLAAEAGLTLYEQADLGTDTWGGGVAVLGDLDGDGQDDLAIGTPAAEHNAGVVSILFSSRSPTSGSSTLKTPDILRLSAPNSDGGFGMAVAAIGDFDGDEVSELAVGQPDYVGDTTKPQGAVHVYYSRDLAAGTADQPRTLAGTRDGDATGKAVVALGDVDGDTQPDFAVGAPEAMRGVGDSPSGVVYIVSGARVDELSDLSEVKNHFVGGVGTRFGESIAAGDFDSDGINDIALGAPGVEPGGEVYVIYGSTIKSLDGGEFSLVDGDGADLRLTTENQGGNFGAALALGGSLDGDDIDDLVVGSSWAYVPSAPSAGEVYVMLGKQGFPTTGSFAIQHAADFTLQGVEEGQALGSSVTYVGDINNDDSDDLVVGATDSGSSSQGAAYLLLGPYQPGVASPVTGASVAFSGKNDFDNIGLMAAPAGSYTGAEFPGFFLYSPSAEIYDGDGTPLYRDVPAWYLFDGPFWGEQ